MAHRGAHRIDLAGDEADELGLGHLSPPMTPTAASSPGSPASAILGARAAAAMA
jgi:hypothetical protein